MLSTKLNTFSNQNSIPFGAGKVYLWLDNDGTYTPFSSPIKLDIAVQDPQTKIKLEKYFQNFDEFIKDSEGKVQLNITTGKKLGGFLDVVNNILQKGIKFVLPDTIITGDGSNTYKTPDTIKNNNHIDKNELIHNSEIVDSIRSKTNWDNKVIEMTIKKELTKLGFKIITLREDFNKNNDTDIKKLKEKNANIPFAIISERGDLNFSVITFNKNIYPNKVKKILNDSLKAQNISLNIRIDKSHNSIQITPLLDGEIIDKSFQIKTLIKKANKENDLIIVAGDGSNDISMLNRQSYKKLIPEGNIPLKSIIIEHEERSITPQSPMNLVSSDLKGHYTTVIKPFNLLEGIKTSIAKYAIENNEFANALPASIKESIKPLTVELTELREEEVKAKLEKEKKKQEAATNEMPSSTENNNKPKSFWQKLIDIFN